MNGKVETLNESSKKTLNTSIGPQMIDPLNGPNTLLQSALSVRFLTPLSLVILLLSLPTSGFASSDQTGVLTQIEGIVKVFKNPSKRFEGPSPRVLFEGTYYTVETVKAGDQVKPGNILRTASGSKAKIIFENGDQMLVGPATSYRIGMNDSAQKAAPEVDLHHGRIRGVISKQGPRSGLMIRTRSATMGVRGTDFTVADHGPVHGTEVAVLRGKVEVKPQSQKAKAIEVNSGFSAEVKSTPAIEALSGTSPKSRHQEEQVEVRRTSKAELVEIHKQTTLSPQSRKLANVSEKTKKELETLEKKAIETTLQDIKASDPQLFTKLSQEKNPSAQRLNAMAVQNVFKSAPSTPPKRSKPSRESLEEIEKDAYERFFKVE